MKNLLIKENHSSKNLFEKINILNEQQLSSIAQGLDWTLNNISSAVLIGGTAVIYYITGARDLTPDLDFMVHDISLVKNRLSMDDIHYSELNVGYEQPLGLTVESLNTDYLDSQIGNSKLNNLILSTYILGNIGGRQVKIINPELLAISKFETSRNKDVNDAFSLLSSGKINKEKYNKYLSELKPTLNDYESIKSYNNFIV